MDRFGNLPGYGTVWYKPTGIANIISLSKTTQNFFVALDIEMMLAIPVGLYQTVPYPGMFPTLSTILTPLL